MPELAGPVWELGMPLLAQAVFDGAPKSAGPFVVFPKN
jgi:hypothetical protein